MLKTNNFELERVKLGKIKVNGNKLRTKIKEDISLRGSLYKDGQITPLIVLKDYTLISGFRRYNEMKKLGARYAWVIKIEGLNKDDILLYQLAEVLHTKTLNPIDKAKAYKKMIDSLKVSQRKLAKILNVSKSDVEYHIKMLSLPKDIQNKILERRMRPYSRDIEFMMGKRKIRDIKDMDNQPNSLLYESLLRRLYSMRILIRKIEFDKNMKKKTNSVLNDIKEVIG